MNQATNNTSDPFVTKSILDAALEGQWKKAEATFVTKETFNTAMKRVDERFDMVDFRFNTLEAKMDAGFALINKKYDRMMNAIDGFMGRVDNIEANDAARNARLDRHDRWHHQVADTLHLKLE